MEHFDQFKVWYLLHNFNCNDDYNVIVDDIPMIQWNKTQNCLITFSSKQMLLKSFSNFVYGELTEWVNKFLNP